MDSKRVIVLSEKESFLVKVLVNKTRELGVDCDFVMWNEEEINSNYDNAGLVTMYMEEGERPLNEVLKLIVSKLNEKKIPFILIGGAKDIKYINDRIPKELIYKTFFRPLENVHYIEAVKEVFDVTAKVAVQKNVMIVDDDPNYLTLVRGWLKDTYKVSMAKSGLQAIKMLGNTKPDLILLDYEMPVTSGPQVLEMLRSDDDTKDIPVIFLTGKDDKESVVAVLALRPDGYFLKSIKKDDLLDKLKDFFVLHK